MSSLQVTLFGQFHVNCGGTTLTTLKNRRVQELFAYLLLHRGQPQHREILANMIWEDTTPAQSKSYLRKTLWQLQAALNEVDESLGQEVLQVDDEWIGIHPDARIELDVARFEDAFARTQGVPTREIDPASLRSLGAAVELYGGNLLEGWYQDWCLFERERLQQIYFVMLDKLMDCCEAHQEWERGLMYGSLILRLDIARERTHRRMMRLYCLARDRTAALRQFERCRQALQAELGVAPSRRTLSLYRQICQDDVETHRSGAGQELAPSLPAVLDDLEELNDSLAKVRAQVDQQIKVIEALIERSQQPAIQGLPPSSQTRRRENHLHPGPC